MTRQLRRDPVAVALDFIAAEQAREAAAVAAEAAPVTASSFRQQRDRDVREVLRAVDQRRPLRAA